MSVLVWSVFRNGEHARAGVERLIESSFPPDEIKVMLRDAAGFHDVPMERKTAMSAGAAFGATLGATGAAGVVLLTGGGALIAAGPALALLQAAGLGAWLGAIVGAVGGLSWWTDEADIPDAADLGADTRVLVLIPVPAERQSEAQAALRAALPEHVGHVGSEFAARAHDAAASGAR